MRWARQVKLLVLSWFRSSRLDSDLDEELQFHIQTEIERNERAGMRREDALRAARLAVGGPDQIRDECRESRPGAFVRQLLRDVRYGGRLLRKTPGFSAAAIVIVAVGIGAVTAIFSVVDGVVLQPLPYPQPDRLVSLWSRMPRVDLPRAFVNAADYQVWRRDNHVFDDVALVRPMANFNLTGGGEPERLFGARVSPNLLAVLGTGPIIGRGFRSDEDTAGRDRVVLLSHDLWTRRFGADAGIVGQAIRLSGVPHTVVGVMGPRFRYPTREFQVWTPLTINPAELSREDPSHNYLAVGRLKRGVTLQQAQSEMSTICERLARQFPDNRDVGVHVVPMPDDAVATVRPALYVLLSAVTCLLLIACLNLSNLLGARAAARHREFALRLSLGASRGRLVLQAIAEVMPLLAIGGLIGIVGAWWAVRAFIPLAPASLPRIEAVGMSGTVLLVATTALVLTGLTAAMVPAFSASRARTMTVSAEGGRTTTGGRREVMTAGILVVAQIALVVPLLVTAMLLSRTFSALTRVDPGFRPANVLTMHLAIPRSKYPEDLDIARVCGRVVDAVQSLPGVACAGMVNRLPLGGVAQIGHVVFENAAGVDPTLPSSDWRSVTPGYFAAMGIGLREGRLFTERDADRPAVGLVDERVAKTMWPGQSAVGKRFRIPVDGQPWVEVVGVVGHVLNDGLDVDPRPQVYWPYRQRAQDRMVLVVRARDDAARLSRPVIDAIHKIDPDQPVYDVRTMEQVMERSLGQRWLSAALVGSFATISLVLAAVGLYGVVAFGVTRRLREFGIRLALGATGRDVTRQVIGQAALLSSVGVAVGVAGALFAATLVEGLVYGVNPRDVGTVAACCGVLLAVTLVAAYVPARRAARVDPAMTLRAE
jgi:putative ABC transport system permease protein